MEHLQKTKKLYKKLKKQEIQDIFIKNELDKACLQYDMAYGDFKYLTRRTASDKILRYKAFDIDENPKYDGSQRRLVSTIYKFFDKKTSATRANKFPGSGIKNEDILNNK